MTVFKQVTQQFDSIPQQQQKIKTTYLNINAINSIQKYALTMMNENTVISLALPQIKHPFTNLSLLVQIIFTYFALEDHKQSLMIHFPNPEMKTQGRVVEKMCSGFCIGGSFYQRHCNRTRFLQLDRETLQFQRLSKFESVCYCALHQFWILESHISRICCCSQI